MTRERLNAGMRVRMTFPWPQLSPAELFAREQGDAEAWNKLLVLVRWYREKTELRIAVVSPRDGQQTEPWYYLVEPDPTQPYGTPEHGAWVPDWAVQPIASAADSDVQLNDSEPTRRDTGRRLRFAAHDSE